MTSTYAVSILAFGVSAIAYVRWSAPWMSAAAIANAVAVWVWWPSSNHAGFFASEWKPA